jgi:hypothetical protein
MTKEEFIEKYGEVKVKFSSYYKYTFNYIGTLPDGNVISVDCGGNADYIYRYEVVPDMEESVSSIDPYAGRVRDKDYKVTDQFYDY